MINAIINGIMSLIMTLVNVILAPIDTLITNYLPSLDEALTAFSGFLNLCGTYIGWCIDFLGIPSQLISLIILYYTFKLTVPLLISAIKTAIKWYNALKL